MTAISGPIQKEIDSIRPTILDLLTAGSVDSPNGRCTALIADTLNGPSVAVVSAALLDMERRGDIVRDVRGRRVFTVRLVTPLDDLEAIAAAVEARCKAQTAIRVESWHRNRSERERLGVLHPVTDVPAPAVHDQTPEPTAGLRIVAQTPEPTIDHDELAATLLRAVIDAAALPARIAREHDEAINRLGQINDENLRLRTKLREASDQLAAQQVQIDGLRMRAQAAEGNLKRAIAAPLDVARERELRDLARTMTAKPGAYSGNGERS